MKWVVTFSLESFDHPTKEVRGDPGLSPDGMGEFRVSGFSLPRKWPTLATMRPSRRWGTHFGAWAIRLWNDSVPWFQRDAYDSYVCKSPCVRNFQFSMHQALPLVRVEFFTFGV